MVDVSVVIPARNEQFLPQTIEDLVKNARANTEIIAVLDGYWPERMVEAPNVHYIHHTEPRGMRGALNAGVAIAKGRFVMKLDGHCMVAEGFDKVLSETCQDNWVCIPTRHRLDAESWRINNGGRPPINYQFINLGNDGLDGKEWRQKNKDKSLDAIRVDDIIAAQGSCYFLPRDLWYELELLDEEHYGTFRKDPQEVMFKCWTSGGRCVRVKDTWYAHLYKGKRYGRGYSTSRPDWAKGDEYVKKWWTDSAWDKQKIPLREIFRKFPDMPGWKDHPWMQGAQVAEPDYSSLPNLYQYLEIDGRPFSRPRLDRAGSKFWNAGRWQTFIAPLLPSDVTDQTFVEMGADAGLFLKLAADHGFRRVVGVEKNQTPVREGLRWRDAIGGEWVLLKRKLGDEFGGAGSFDFDELPVIDVLLMSTFHYYIDIAAWMRLLDRLATKACHVLLVSRPTMPQHHWLARADYAAVSEYFADWEELGKVEGVPMEGDSKPRQLYSVIFRSPTIRRVDIDAIDVRLDPQEPTRVAKEALAQLIAGGEAFDPFDTDYYRVWTRRKRKEWSKRTLRRYVQMKVDVMQDVAANGQREALLVERGGLALCDGGHRLTMLKALGHKSVIVREI